MVNLGIQLSISLTAQELERVNLVLGDGWTTQDFKEYVLEKKEPPTPLEIISKTIIDNPEMTTQTLRQLKSFKDMARNLFRG